jgi:hypothetical protein
VGTDGEDSGDYEKIQVKDNSEILGIEKDKVDKVKKNL